ncbi:MAK10-like protein [Tanacetum coccineum]
MANGTKSYPVGIVKDVEVHKGKLKLLNDFYVIDVKKDPKTLLLVGRGFLATANAVIDYIKAKIAIGEGITRSVFSVKGVDLGEKEAPYWTTLRKRESYNPQPSSDGVGRKAHLLEDKQIPSVGVFDEVFSTWMTFRGNTRDLDSFEEETNKITDLQQIHKEVLFTVRGDGIACIKRCHRDLSSNGNKKRSSGRESGSGPTYRGSRIMQVATACRDFNTTPSLDLWSPFLDRSRCIALCIALPSSTPL